MFDRALAELGLGRAQRYVTNAAKHFRFECRDKARMHRDPEACHVNACRIWRERELTMVQPGTVVCLGALATCSVLGRDFQLMRQRGTWQAFSWPTRAFATAHPSWALRQRDPATRNGAYRLD